MKKTGAWLTTYALEQVGVKYTFGIPGVHNTEIYDELNNSEQIEPILITHESAGSFMADAVSRTSNSIGTMVIVPAAGASYASAGMGEAFMAGVPMLVISGGIRSNSQFTYQLHEMDQHALLAPVTKKTYLLSRLEDIIPSIFDAYHTAISGLPGPVFVEIPVNLQLEKGEIANLPTYSDFQNKIEAENFHINIESIQQAASLLRSATNPGLFVGWGAKEASELLIQIAEFLKAPVSTTLQGLSVFPANHPLHVGMGFGHAAVPAATHAFKNVDCMLAIGTRFAEIPTGSFGVSVPHNLIHIDIDPRVLNANFPAAVAIQGDAVVVLELLYAELCKNEPPFNKNISIEENIRADKKKYAEEWAAHDSGNKINPALFFEKLRDILDDDDFVVADDGNHTFLTAELMPIHQSKHFISPSDFNCMGYCVPAVIATKLMNPNKQVVGIVGDGAFAMTCMEIITAYRLLLGGIFFVFNDGELSQISQAQEIPYNRKTCTVLGDINVAGVAEATGAHFLLLHSNNDIENIIQEAIAIANTGKPVIVNVKVDYSKRTRFTKGIVKTNLMRFDTGTKARFIGRAIKRKVLG